jgi:FAD/FMN-containing dehydrogenase
MSMRTLYKPTTVSTKFGTLRRRTPDFLGDLSLTVAALQGILGEAMTDKARLRAIGGGWSLSAAAVTDGRLIDTRPMNWYFPIAPTGVVPAYPGNVGQLMYLQCGVTIDEANALLFQQAAPLALKTSGASNGQTIVGAVSTGTHGSRFQFGATPDYVVGMHIITAPDRVIWLEQASYPVISDDLAAKLGVEIVRDDTLFSSALVSFGSFGLLHGVLIETEPLYLLEAWRKRIPIDASLKQAMQTLTFGGIPLQYPDTTPFHFEVVVNPHDTASGAYVTAMWQRAYAPGYPTPPQTPAGLGPGDNLLGFMGTLGSVLPGLVPAMVNRLVAAEYPHLRSAVRHSRRDI